MWGSIKRFFGYGDEESSTDTREEPISDTPKSNSYVFAQPLIIELHPNHPTAIIKKQQIGHEISNEAIYVDGDGDEANGFYEATPQGRFRRIDPKDLLCGSAL
eukprot:TRINITY_DN4041_c0_g1_i3.p1 TRINITY_DN4041_c0_g1~~TRINITY_DN4041_c0_g1_i3.p1  ORF type:complete len:103 (-),score=27.95 TRINITY_DN4041_c0_g1_i3:659-967(-)